MNAKLTEILRVARQYLKSEKETVETFGYLSGTWDDSFHCKEKTLIRAMENEGILPFVVSDGCDQMPYKVTYVVEDIMFYFIADKYVLTRLGMEDLIPAEQKEKE